jgi:hypothetical protein
MMTSHLKVGLLYLHVLNFEIVLSIGSSAGYGRISQQEEISFILLLTHLQGTCTALAKHESIR